MANQDKTKQNKTRQDQARQGKTNYLLLPEIRDVFSSTKYDHERAKEATGKRRENLEKKGLKYKEIVFDPELARLYNEECKAWGRYTANRDHGRRVTGIIPKLEEFQKKGVLPKKKKSWFY